MQDPVEGPAGFADWHVDSAAGSGGPGQCVRPRTRTGALVNTDHGPAFPQPCSGRRRRFTATGSVSPQSEGAPAAACRLPPRGKVTALCAQVWSEPHGGQPSRKSTEKHTFRMVLPFVSSWPRAGCAGAGGRETRGPRGECKCGAQGGAEAESTGRTALGRALGDDQ